MNLKSLWSKLECCHLPECGFFATRKPLRVCQNYSNTFCCLRSRDHSHFNASTCFANMQRLDRCSHGNLAAKGDIPDIHVERLTKGQNIEKKEHDSRVCTENEWWQTAQFCHAAAAVLFRTDFGFCSVRIASTLCLRTGLGPLHDSTGVLPSS